MALISASSNMLCILRSPDRGTSRILFGMECVVNDPPPTLFFTHAHWLARHLHPYRLYSVHHRFSCRSWIRLRHIISSDCSNFLISISLIMMQAASNVVVLLVCISAFMRPITANLSSLSDKVPACSIVDSTCSEYSDLLMASDLFMVSSPVWISSLYSCYVVHRHPA
jgi:hypothetical protein